MKRILVIIGGIVILFSCSPYQQNSESSDTLSLEDWYNNVFSQAAEDTAATIPDYAYTTEWMKRYVQYIKENYENRGGDIWFHRDTAESYDCRYWTMAYVDNDTIPELLLYGGCQASGSIILTQYEGAVYASPKGRFSYIKGADGLLHSQWKYEDNAFGGIYEMKNGKFTELYSYDCTVNFSDSNEADSLKSVRQALDSLYYSKGTSAHFPFPEKKMTIDILTGGE